MNIPELLRRAAQDTRGMAGMIWRFGGTHSVWSERADEYDAAAAEMEQAEALEVQAASAVTVAPTFEAPAAPGAHARRIWKAKLTDKMALIQAVADGKASPELLDYNESVGNGLAKALKSGLNVPGMTAYEDISIASR